jgi:hypothetical protein
MEIFVDGPDGGSTEKIDVTKLEDGRLRTLAKFGSSEARAELKKRIGIDPFKSLDELTDEDADYYMEWLKNNDPEKYNKIVSIDEESE